MKEYVLLIFTAVCVSSLSVGCTEMSKRDTELQEEHLALVDQKIREIEQRITNMDTNYSNLNANMSEMSSKIESKDNSLKTIISETQKNISDLLKRLGEIEKGKTGLQNQIIALQTQISHIAGSGTGWHNEVIKEEDKVVKEGCEMIKELKSEKDLEDDKKIGNAASQKLPDEALALYRGGNYKEVSSKKDNMVMIEEGYEWEEVHDKELKSEKKPQEDKIVEKVTSNQRKDTVKKLLDEAVRLYRDENYQEAISTWEKVLIFDPKNIEAKYNIEIVMEKIQSSSTSEK